MVEPRTRQVPHWPQPGVVFRLNVHVAAMVLACTRRRMHGPCAGECGRDVKNVG